MTTLQNAFPTYNGLIKKQQEKQNLMRSSYKPKIAFCSKRGIITEGHIVYPYKETRRPSPENNVVKKYAGCNLSDLDAVYNLNRSASGPGGSTLLLKGDKYVLISHGSGIYIIGSETGTINKNIYCN